MRNQQGRRGIKMRLVLGYSVIDEAPRDHPARAVTQMLDSCLASARDEGLVVSDQAVNLPDNASTVVVAQYVSDLLRRFPQCIIFIGRRDGIVSSVDLVYPDEGSDDPDSATEKMHIICHFHAPNCGLTIIESIDGNPAELVPDKTAAIQAGVEIMRQDNCVTVIFPVLTKSRMDLWSKSLRRRYYLSSRRQYCMAESDSSVVNFSATSLPRVQPMSYGGPSLSSGHAAPPRLQSRTREDPLPHDGLFIRRNNAFGTKSTLGIADLIDQGVLIDQTQIRFDDFIASRTDQVPQPPVDEAVAVSHGSTPVMGGSKAHNATTHFLEIALRAGSIPPHGVTQGEILPVNFVFVVDTSSSMHGEKLDMVKTSIRELYSQLRDIDILGIVTFDNEAKTVLRATRKSDLSPERLTEVVAGLFANGGTDLNLGVLFGINEIERYGHDRSDMVNCLYLFSDGDPTSGETNWIKIRTNISAQIRGHLTLSCFGFGSDARIRELEALAGLTGGHSTFVTDPEDVRLNLVDDLTRREHLAAINIQLQIDIDHAVRIWHLYGHDLITDPVARDEVIRDAQAARHRAREKYGAESQPDLITQDEGIRIFAPDLAFGETYWIVFELEVPSGKINSDLGRATVQYVDTVTRTSRRNDLSLTREGAIPAATVAAHAIGLWTSEITFYALDDLYENDRETATRRLSNHIQILQQVHSFLPDTQFRDDQVTIMKLISLASNLGHLMRSSDHRSNEWQYTQYTMNQFGRARAGFAKRDHMAF